LHVSTPRHRRSALTYEIAVTGDKLVSNVSEQVRIVIEVGKRTVQYTSSFEEAMWISIDSTEDTEE